MLVLSCLLMGTLSSCGSDEPESTTVIYYLDVKAVFLVNGSSNYADGYKNPITLMNESIRKVYPTPDAVGNDEAVIAACDEVYAMVCNDYAVSGDHLTCEMDLTKANKTGTILRDHEVLKNYTIDVNPIEVPAE